MTLVALGGVTDLVDQAYSGFDYPANRTMLALLENAVGSSGNVVIQEASLPYRQANLSVLVESYADWELLRDLKDAGDPVDFTDNRGLERSVLIYSMSSSQHAGGEGWDVAFVLLEIVEPAAGS